MPIPMPVTLGCCMNDVSAVLMLTQREVPLPASRSIDPDRSSITKMSSGTGSALMDVPTQPPPVLLDPPEDDDDDTNGSPPVPLDVPPPLPPDADDVLVSSDASQAPSERAIDVAAPI